MQNRLFFCFVLCVFFLIAGEMDFLCVQLVLRLFSSKKNNNIFLKAKVKEIKTSDFFVYFFH